MSGPWKYALFTVVAALALAAQGDSAEPNAVKTFMEAKLTHAQKVLEGLATEDYDMIAKHSQELSLLSQAASWQVLQTADYRQHSAEFRRTADAIRDAAKEKNLDGASLAYVELTVRCVNCHKHVRKVKMAELSDSWGRRVARAP